MDRRRCEGAVRSARWGKGYFSVNDAGHVCVHPTKDPARAIDLKELVDRLQLRGLDLPILIRFNGILKDRLRRNPRRLRQAPSRSTSTRAATSASIRSRSTSSGTSSSRSCSYGTAVRLRPGSRQQAGAAGRRGDDRRRHADHLQRLQGRRVHRDGDAGPEDRPQRHSRRREIHRAGADPQIRREGRRAAARSACAIKLAARGSGRWQSSGGYRSKFGLTVSEILHAARGAEEPRHARLLQAAALSPGQPDHQHPPRQGAP